MYNLIFCLTFLSIIFSSPKFNAPLRAIHNNGLFRSLSEVESSYKENYNVFIDKKNNDLTLKVIIKMSDLGKLELLKEIGVRIHTILESGIISAWIPINILDQLYLIEELEYVHLTEKRRKKLNLSLEEIKVDQIHSGALELPIQYKGSNVIVGVIDGGIDINHKDFKNDDGSTRILAYWNQETSYGNPPKNYSYGNENWY